MARPRDKSGLSPTTERELAWWLAKGHGIEDAAKRVGLPSSERVYQLKRARGFADDLRQALKDQLSVELAPKAVRILDEIMADTAMPARVRVDAAKTLLDRAGFTPAAIAADAPPAIEEMSRLSREQLEALVEQLSRQTAREESDRRRNCVVALGRTAAVANCLVFGRLVARADRPTLLPRNACAATATSPLGAPAAVTVPSGRITSPSRWRASL